MLQKYRIYSLLEFAEYLKGKVLSNEPFFVTRQGGSDYNYVANYYIKNSTNPLQLCEYNGYYDKSQDPNERENNLKMFRDNYIKVLTKADFTIGVCNDIERAVYQNPLTQTFTTNKTYVSYSFIENLPDSSCNFLLDIMPLLEGKKVLVVSPFGPLIISQYNNHRQGIFEKFAELPGEIGQRYRDFKYPEFASLESVQTFITYNDMKNQDHCPHKSYHETIQYYKDEIAKKNFDIALLCCGAYTCELGLFIRDSLRRQAIYMGGALQLYFGIKGDRYSYLGPTINVSNGMNDHIQKGFDVLNECWVDPPIEELHPYLREKMRQTRKTEGMGAYFVSAKYGKYFV